MSIDDYGLSGLVGDIDVLAVRADRDARRAGPVWLPDLETFEDAELAGDLIALEVDEGIGVRRHRIDVAPVGAHGDLIAARVVLELANSVEEFLF